LQEDYQNSIKLLHCKCQNWNCTGWFKKKFSTLDAEKTPVCSDW